MKNYVSAKLHDVIVTDKSIEYRGSVSICAKLMEAAGIDPYERVQVVNLTTGARWETYALPAPPGQFTLNGGGARLGEVGDRCVVMTYVWGDIYRGANVVFCDQNNAIRETMRYEGA